MDGERRPRRAETPIRASRVRLSQGLTRSRGSPSRPPAQRPARDSSQGAVPPIRGLFGHRTPERTTRAGQGAEDAASGLMSPAQNKIDPGDISPGPRNCNSPAARRGNADVRLRVPLLPARGEKVANGRHEVGCCRLRSGMRGPRRWMRPSRSAPHPNPLPASAGRGRCAAPPPHPGKNLCGAFKSAQSGAVLAARTLGPTP